MHTLCQLFGKTRQAFYEATWRMEQETMQEVVMVEQIKTIRKDVPRLGAGKLLFRLTDFLGQHQIKLGRDKLYGLLQANHLLYGKNRNRMKTTQSHHRYYKYPNLVKEIKPYKSNSLWVSDITYIPTGEYCSYLSLVTDAYSRKIVGWSLQANLQATGVVEALKMAIEQLPQTVTGFIHHSDRGIQ
jgi:transposase InsO family protein